MRTAKLIWSWLEQNTASGYLHWCKSKWMNGETLRGFFCVADQNKDIVAPHHKHHSSSTCIRDTDTHLRIHQHFDAISVWQFFLHDMHSPTLFFSYHRFGWVCLCLFASKQSTHFSISFVYTCCSSINCSANAVEPTQSNYAHTTCVFINRFRNQ